jgi:polyisoprenoid-binding protein YceI
MKILTNTLSLFLLFLVTSNLTAQDMMAKSWELDQNHTSVNFGVKHFFNTVNGIFQKKEGTFNFDPKDLSDSKFTFKIPVASIDTNIEKRDKHLTSSDFFDAETYPYITFNSTKISNISRSKTLQNPSPSLFKLLEKWNIL